MAQGGTRNPVSEWAIREEKNREKCVGVGDEQEKRGGGWGTRPNILGGRFFQKKRRERDTFTFLFFFISASCCERIT
jgi:hypothetical protein